MRCREFCLKLQAFHSSWEHQDMQQRLIFDQTLGVYQYLRLRSRAEKIILDIERAKLELLLYTQLHAFELHLNGTADVEFLAASLNALSNKLGPSIEKSMDITPHSKSLGIRKFARKFVPKSARRDKARNLGVQRACTNPSTSSLQNSLDRGQDYGDTILERISTTESHFDTLSIGSTATGETHRTGLSLDITSFIIPIEIKDSVQYQAGDILLCEINGETQSGSIKDHMLIHVPSRQEEGFLEDHSELPQVGARGLKPVLQGQSTSDLSLADLAFSKNNPSYKSNNGADLENIGSDMLIQCRTFQDKCTQTITDGGDDAFRERRFISTSDEEDSIGALVGDKINQMEENSEGSDMQHISAITRLTDGVQEFPDEEAAPVDHVDYVDSDPEAIMNCPLDPQTALFSDEELNHEPTVNDTHQVLAIPATSSMPRCESAETQRSLFCAAGWSVTEKRCVLYLKEPCVPTRHCKHVTVEGLPRGAVLGQSPCKVSLDTTNCENAPEYILESVSQLSSCVLAGIPDSRGYESCLHTLVENEHPDQVQCVLPTKLRASVEEDESISVDLDNDTERPASNGPENSLESEKQDWPSDNDQTQMSDDESWSDAGFPLKPAPEDDANAFHILRGILCESVLEIPDVVDLETLLYILQLGDKYDLGEVHLQRAKDWAELLRPQIPKYFNQKAVAWLWILWKLKMGPEFKALSGVVQQQARHPIDQDDSQYQVLLPKQIIDQIERRRLSALRTVKNLLDVEMDSNREAFREASTNPKGTKCQPAIVLSSCKYLCLSIESERLFGLNGIDNGGVTFEGVSFAGVCCHIKENAAQRMEYMRSLTEGRFGSAGSAGLFGFGASAIGTQAGVGTLLSYGATCAPPVALALGMLAGGVTVAGATRQSMQTPSPDPLRDALERAHRSLIQQALNLIASLEEEDWGVDLIVSVDE
ncbi:hypothetical protein AUP68_04513 [Ilyonectria robusta]